MSDSTTKNCRECGEKFPWTAEYFVKNKNCTDGLQRICYLCHLRIKRIQSREFHLRKALKNPQHTINHPGQKFCKKCGSWKPATPQYFNRRKKYKNGLDTRCKTCLKVDKRKSHEREIGTESYRLRVQRGAKKHNLKHRVHKTLLEEKRRAIKLKLPCDFNDDDWQYALQYFDHRCAICGRTEDETHKIVRDHWIPITDPRSDNPGTVPSNIVPLCHGIRGCNNLKQAIEPTQWLVKRYKDKAMEIETKIRDFFLTVRQTTSIEQKRGEPDQY